MKRNLVVCLAALVVVFVLSVPAQAWDAGAYGYPPELVTQLRGVCYDPNAVWGLQPNWPTWRLLVYKWLEPRNLAQEVVYDLTGGPGYGFNSFNTARAWKYAYCPKTFGQWLDGAGKALSRNPWYNTDLLVEYLATVDRGAWRAAELAARLGDAAAVAAQEARAFGPFSYAVVDINGLTVKNAAGYTDAQHQPSMADIPWWVKPADCSPATLPTVTPISNPPQPTPAPSTQPWCKNPTTGVCAQLPSMFGNVCPDGWIACGTVTPTPTRTPTVNPTPLSSAIVACLATDGRYAYPATVCRPDEIPLVRK